MFLVLESKGKKLGPPQWGGDGQILHLLLFQATRCLKRISGPLMDRIDIYMQAPREEFRRLRDMRPGEPSVYVRARVETAQVHLAEALQYQPEPDVF